jgi:hypothetical protein
MVAQVEYSVAGRLRGQVALCVICTMHVDTRSADFLVEPQNQGRRFVSGLTSKPLGRFFSSLPSKLMATVFFDLASKPVARVSRFGASKPTVPVW